MGICYNSTSVDKDSELVQNDFPNGKFVQDALDSHNKYRKKHGVPPLKINSDLCKISQQWAEKIASTENFEHSSCKWGSKNIGENIALCSGQQMTGQFMTDMWYEEIKDYDFKNPGFTDGTGHFTQLVWKESKELGVGLSISSNGDYYAVANYFPAGNDIDAFAQNVFKA